MTLGDKHEKTHIFDTRFTGSLKDHGPGHVMDWMWRRQQDVSDCKRMIFMFNDGLHYVVVSVDVPQRTVTKCDPLGGETVQHHEHVTDLLGHLESAERVPSSNGKRWSRRFAPKGTPRQKDGVSCGVVCCLYANLLSRGKSLESLRTCNREPHYRAHIGALIACLHKGIVVNKQPDTVTIDVEEEIDNKQEQRN